VLIAGEMEPELRAHFETQRRELEQNSKIQIVTDLRHIPESEVEIYFQLADVVLLAYSSHIGSSGVQVRAAAASKPVISSQHGLIGTLTREYGLGLTVNPQIPASIAAALTRASNEPLASLGAVSQMQAFAAAQSPVKFAETIFDNLERKTVI
jgi:glycosyltransferase involved in cell wall biosynthesis